MNSNIDDRIIKLREIIKTLAPETINALARLGGFDKKISNLDSQTIQQDELLQFVDWGDNWANFNQWSNE